jgi:surface antigen
VRRLIAGALSAGALAVAAGSIPVHADSTGLSPAAQQAAYQAQLAAAQGQLSDAQAAVANLTQMLDQARQQVVAADQKAADDKAKEDELRQQISALARNQYQTEGGQMLSVLQSRTIADLWNNLAEARVVAEHQQTLLNQLDAMRRADEAARAQARGTLNSVARSLGSAEGQVALLEGRIGGYAVYINGAGQLAGTAGRVPSARVSQNTGLDGQCTWYAEQAYATYSDPKAPGMMGDGADVVANLARAEHRSPESEPQPGSLISWSRQFYSPYGHVGYVASVDKDGSGNITGYTVWEMNYQGPFIADARHVNWTGPNWMVQFLSPPQPTDPIAAEIIKYGPH